MPLTRAQPTSASSKAVIFRPVSGSFHKTAENNTTMDGAKYSNIPATASEHSCWQLK